MYIYVCMYVCQPSVSLLCSSQPFEKSDFFSLPKTLYGARIDARGEEPGVFSLRYGKYHVAEPDESFDSLRVVVGMLNKCGLCTSGECGFRRENLTSTPFAERSSISLIALPKLLNKMTRGATIVSSRSLRRFGLNLPRCFARPMTAAPLVAFFDFDIPGRVIPSVHHDRNAVLCAK